MPELRLKYYGLEDHVRAYGMDFADRIRGYGLNVEQIQLNKNYSEKEKVHYGIKGKSFLFICKSGKSSTD